METDIDPVESEINLAVSQEIKDRRKGAPKKFLIDNGDVKNTYVLSGDDLLEVNCATDYKQYDNTGKEGCQSLEGQLTQITSPKKQICIHGSVSCEMCQNKSIESHSLDKLTEMVDHLNKSPYSCHLCNKQFQYNSYLQRHLLTHTGEKRFTCSSCGLQFDSSSAFKEHKLTHTDIEPYICSVCPRLFKFESIYKRHMRIHSGDKPYSCKICGQQFNRAFSLKRI